MTLLKVAQVSDRLNLRPETVRRMIKRGELPAVRLSGGHLRVREADVEGLLQPASRDEGAQVSV